MTCPRCNAQLTDDASFCGICGAALPAPQARVPEARPAFQSPDSNEATIVAGPLPGGPAPQRATPPVAPPTSWSGQGAPAGGPPGAFQGPPPVASPPGGQPGPWQGPPPGGPPAFQGPPLASGAFQGPSAAPWSPQQQPPADWMAGQGKQAPGGSAPARLDAGGAVAQAPVAQAPRKRRRRAGCLWTVISLLVLLGLLVGAWFLGVRPYLHNLAQQQLDQALSGPENQILLSMLAIPPGVPLPDQLKVIRGTETSMNSYLSDHTSDQVQNMHMTITPSGMSLSFTAYGQNCVVSALPVLASNGEIQVTNVQVQGVLSFIMSNDELASALNANLQNFSTQMTHKVTKITLLDHEIDVQLS
jgi:hypothetical protein